jgi:hypothetical protein
MVPQPFRHEGDVALCLRRIKTTLGVVHATEHHYDLGLALAEGLRDPLAHITGGVAGNPEIDGPVALASNDA